MKLSSLLAKHLRDVYFGGNLTSVSFKDAVNDVSRQQATATFASLNTIATLLFHTNYYVVAITGVLRGGPLDAHDKFSFDLKPLNAEEDWQALRNKTFADAETLATLIETLPEEQLAENFAGEKYGSFYRNLQGLVEHCHYHLGQIILIKKLLSENGSPASKNE